MQKSIELERRGKWYELRHKIVSQRYESTCKYPFPTDEYRQAMNAIRQVAKKYKFKIAMVTESDAIPDQTVIVVLKTRGDK